MVIGKYKNNPTEDKKEDIETKSVAIADMIQDWIEEAPAVEAVVETPEKEEPEKKTVPPVKEEKTVAPEKTEKEVKTDGDTDNAKEMAIAEKEILAFIEKQGFIWSDQLKIILKEKNINKVPDDITVGKTKLIRSFARWSVRK